MCLCTFFCHSPCINFAPWQSTFNLWQKSSTVTPDWHLWNVQCWSLPFLPSSHHPFFFKLIAHLLCHVYFGLILLFTAALRPFHCLSASWYYNANTQVLGLQLLFTLAFTCFLHKSTFSSNLSLLLSSISCFFFFLSLLKLTVFFICLFTDLFALIFLFGLLNLS